MKISIKAYHLDTGELHDMAPKTLIEYSEWIVRSVNRGYKPYYLGDDIVRFSSNKPGNNVVFTAKITD